MTSNITYNQIIELFKDFQNRHYQLNDFYEGTIEELGDSKEIKYPMLAAIPTNSRLEKGSSDNFSQTIYRFNLIVGDTVNGATEEQNVRSDTAQILFDLVAEFNRNEFYFTNNILIESTAEFIPFTERFDDLITGWVLDISIKVPFRYNPCYAPADEKTLTEIITNCNA